ncbi:MAG: hypothetical protein F6K56_03830 [Moorea sp. SIO3G5]|nr:hypothetical protein [Moorena sp. SIO3G5]
MALAKRPRYANGHATRTTLALAKRPRYANGHATRTTVNLKPPTSNLQPWPWPKGHATRMATLREQPWPKGHATRTTE